VADLLTLPVRQFIKATPTSRILRLALGDTPFTFYAGQGATLGLHGQTERKPYSISLAPEQAQREKMLEFLIKVDTAGSPGSHLDDVRRGMRVDVEGPWGSFRFPADPPEERFLFIAGGTGIAPLRAMLWHVLLTRGAGEIGVLYSARSPDEFAYGGELRALARRGRIRLQFTATRDAGALWRGERGRINLNRLGPFVRDPATLCFLCGPPSLIETVPPLLRQLGVAAPRIRTEEW
jgi:ferredoxin-NADP reductase